MRDFAVLAKELVIVAAENRGCGRRRTSDIAEAINAATFHVDASEYRDGNACAAISEQFVGLLCSCDVASEEDHARGLDAGEQGTQAGRHLRAIEANDEELADVTARITIHPRCHEIEVEDGRPRPSIP